ncbi:endochitinase-like [Momordica charantia]|uniref:Endochitinase-like n=1 Tax=Momordica charantia TaxID=3673 RepID=A0A6J1BXB7_MOMCH|nr:endochitinase-like [Momordica charantia]
MLKHRNDPKCEGDGFYSYDAFVEVARSFDGFGTTGDETIRKRELAAFFGQTSHETRGVWDDDAPDDPHAWGYCYVREVDPSDSYCSHDHPEWPCDPDQEYYGRGPIQLTYNYNYGPAGEALDVDLLSHPDLVAIDPIISFKTAIWFWMTPHGDKPSIHDVITDQWHPSDDDIDAGRVPGYGLITNIINGDHECGFPGPNPNVEDRIEFYKRYCDILDIEYGEHLDCYDQEPFNLSVKLSYQM